MLMVTKDAEQLPQRFRMVKIQQYKFASSVAVWDKVNSMKVDWGRHHGWYTLTSHKLTGIMFFGQMRPNHLSHNLCVQMQSKFSWTFVGNLQSGEGTLQTWVRWNLLACSGWVNDRKCLSTFQNQTNVNFTVFHRPFLCKRM